MLPLRLLPEVVRGGGDVTPTATPAEAAAAECAFPTADACESCDGPSELLLLRWCCTCVTASPAPLLGVTLTCSFRATDPGPAPPTLPPAPACPSARPATMSFTAATRSNDANTPVSERSRDEGRRAREDDDADACDDADGAGSDCCCCCCGAEELEAAVASFAAPRCTAWCDASRLGDAALGEPAAAPCCKDFCGCAWLCCCILAATAARALALTRCEAARPSHLPSSASSSPPSSYSSAAAPSTSSSSSSKPSSPYSSPGSRSDLPSGWCLLPNAAG